MPRCPECPGLKCFGIKRLSFGVPREWEQTPGYELRNGHWGRKVERIRLWVWLQAVWEPRPGGISTVFLNWETHQFTKHSHLITDWTFEARELLRNSIPSGVWRENESPEIEKERELRYGRRRCSCRLPNKRIHQSFPVLTCPLVLSELWSEDKEQPWHTRILTPYPWSLVSLSLLNKTLFRIWAEVLGLAGYIHNYHYQDKQLKENQNLNTCTE